MRTNEYATLLSVGRRTPYGCFPKSGAALVLDGHNVLMMFNQLPRRESYGDRRILERGAVEVALLIEGASALLAWRWTTGEGAASVYAADTPFHIGLEHLPHRFLPRTDKGRIPLVIVTQDYKGRCVDMRSGNIGREVTSALVDLCQNQLADMARSDFEVRHRRNIRALMDRAPDPLAAFDSAPLRSSVASAIPSDG